jgi:hypothetical protein
MRRHVNAATRFPPAESPVRMMVFGVISIIIYSVTEHLIEVMQEPHICLEAVVQTTGIWMSWSLAIVYRKNWDTQGFCPFADIHLVHK